MFPTTPLQLYRMPISGHCHRVELMLSLLGLPYELIDVNLLRGEHQRAEFLALNPLGQVPVLQPGLPHDLQHYADPLPQALVLTAIVISFAMTALFLVVLLASRGMSGTDHVDGSHARDHREMP